MQWLIDTIKDWVNAQGYALESWVEAKGYLTTSFIDRGDPAAIDFGVLDFTTDDTWRVLDLSGIIPEDAKAALIYITVSCSIAQKYFSFRKHGNVNAVNISRVRPQIVNFHIANDIIVQLDADRKIDYNASAGCVWAPFVTVKGWWL